MANERQKALIACRQFLYDLDREAPLIDEDVLKLHLDTALDELAEWRPLRKLLTLTTDPTKYAYDLPGDFLSIELASFNSAVNPSQLSFNWNGYQYELGTTSAAKQMQGMPGPLGFGSASTFPFGAFTPPYGQSRSVSFGILFIPGCRFEFAHKDDGSKVLYCSPMPAKAGDVPFLYQARHRITDDTGTAPNVVVGVNTVSPEDRGLLWLRVGQLAAISMQRKMAGDRYASRNFERLAERCGEAFTERAAIFTWSG